MVSVTYEKCFIFGLSNVHNTWLMCYKWDNNVAVLISTCTRTPCGGFCNKYVDKNISHGASHDTSAKKLKVFAPGWDV